MDIYDTRRANLSSLIKSLKMTHASFGKAVGYNGQYIGQLVNGTKRSSGGKAIVTDKVVTKILAKIKDKQPDLSREWFDKPLAAAPAPARGPNVIAEEPEVNYNDTIVSDPTPLLVGDDEFPDYLSSTWPYMSREQRAAIRYLEAGFRAAKKQR